MRKHEAIEAAAQGVLVAGERITSRGICWAVQVPPRKPLLFLARRQYLLALTDRRVLVFRRRRTPSASDLVLAKRYEAFSLERVSRSRPLMQVRLGLANGSRVVFEFRPRQRELGGELVARLTPRSADSFADLRDDGPPDGIGHDRPRHDEPHHDRPHHDRPGPDYNTVPVEVEPADPAAVRAGPEPASKRVPEPLASEPGPSEQEPQPSEPESQPSEPESGTPAPAMHWAAAPGDADPAHDDPVHVPRP